jgi:DNA repair exonuclease SbcCD nuclease subunit
VCEGGGVRVGLQGIGHRSTSQFENVLAEIKPLDDVHHNVLVVHQGLAEMTTTYTKGDLVPIEAFTAKGFDLVIAGHTHRPFYQEVEGTRFLIPGSSERIDSGEFGERKGYYLLRITPDDIESTFRMMDLDQIRKVRRYDVEVNGLSGTEITEQCLQAVTDPDISDAYIYFMVRGQTPQGHRDVDQGDIQERLSERGALAVKVNTDRVMRKEIGELISTEEWRQVRIDAGTFKRLFSERNLRDLSGTPIRNDSIIDQLSSAAYTIYVSVENESKEDIQGVLEKDLLIVAESLHPEGES